MAEFSQELFDRICDRIAEGESLRSICQADDMPSKTSVMRWLANDAALSDQYARAREMQADALFEEILEIADDGSADMRSAGKGDGSLVFDAEHVQRSRLRVEARKWMAGKLRPKVYGDKLALGGADDLPAIKTEDNAAQLLRAKLDEIASRASGGA